MTRSEKLRRKMDLIRPALSSAGRMVLTHPSPTRFYPRYIATMHGISRAAVPLMELAATTVERDFRHHAWARPYADYLRHHIPEETGHDIWALEDLEVMGIRRADILDLHPMPTIAALVGAQYYWIRHVSPIALAGYLSVMEANPPTLAAVESLRTTTGLPEAAFRSMALHARLDVRHELDVYELIDTLPLDDRSERLVFTSAMHTMELLTQALGELVAREISPADRLDPAGIGS